MAAHCVALVTEARRFLGTTRSVLPALPNQDGPAGGNRPGSASRHWLMVHLPAFEVSGEQPGSRPKEASDPASHHPPRGSSRAASPSRQHEASPPGWADPRVNSLEPPHGPRPPRLHRWAPRKGLSGRGSPNCPSGLATSRGSWRIRPGRSRTRQNLTKQPAGVREKTSPLSGNS